MRPSWKQEEQFLQQHYRDIVLRYGDAPEGAQWSSKETQNKRFEILLEIAEIRNASILDFGCGTGGLLEYMNATGADSGIRYAGCDIVSEALIVAKKKYENQKDARFGFWNEFEGESFDYVFISGVFNNKMTNNREYYQDYLRMLWNHTNKGMAFNMMSAYVDYYDDGLFYEKPETVFSFVKKNLSQYVVLRNDYQIKPGVIPFEFVVYVYRKE